MAISAVPWVLLLLMTTVSALLPISIKGTKLYEEDGSQFFVKGVAYQAARAFDPLVDANQCQIDAGLMKDMGVNTVRVYTVDGTQNHDGCMQAFASQNIYVWVDLPTPSVSFNRLEPEWTMDMYSNWTGTIDAFAKYDNLLSFTIANEVINDVNSSITAPYIKAATRDIKIFRDARGYRPIPISYGASDVSSLRLLSAEYFACGDTSEKLDIFGLNVYSWCGNSSYYVSRYDQLYIEFQDIDIPVLFLETGCNAVTPRDFAEVATMLGSVFPATFSGVMVYEWPNNENEYGLVQYENEDGTGFPTTLDDYNALKTVYQGASPVSTDKASYTPSNSPPACPTSNVDWPVAGDGALPIIAGLELSTITPRTTYVTAETTSRSSAGSSATSVTNLIGDSAGIVATEDSGISTGAVTGIAVGGAAVGIAAAVGAFFAIRRRRLARKARQQENEETNAGGNLNGHNDDTAGVFKSELPAQSGKSDVLPKQELQAGHHESCGPWPASQSPRGPASELNSTVKRQSEPCEMEGSWPTVQELQASK